MSSKMRDALEEVQGLAKTIYSTSPKGSAIEELADKIVHKTIVALAEPLRNCEVGTAEEQEDRFADFCRKHECTTNCPIKKMWSFRCGHKPSCGVLWSQMPYEKGGAR